MELGKDKKIQLATCKTHSQLYSHYCKAVGCKKLLCIKCVDPHKVYHQSAASIVTCLSMHDTFLDDMSAYHDKVFEILKAISLLDKPGERLQKFQERLKDATIKIEELSNEIHSCAENKQNTKIGERYGRFKELKKRLSKDLTFILGKIVQADTMYKKLLLLNKSLPLTIIKFENRARQIYFVDPFFENKRIAAINTGITLSENAKVVLFMTSVLLINGSRGELFESVASDIVDPHSHIHFVPRADLLFKLLKDFETANFCNTFLYIIAEGTKANQKYSFYTDRWFAVPPLKLKNQALSVCLLSNRFLYAFRGKSFTIEVLDILAEDLGWHLILPKWDANIKAPLNGYSLFFQQSNETIMILGNTSPCILAIRTNNSVGICFDKTNRKFVDSLLKVPQIGLKEYYNAKDEGRMVYFVEEKYNNRTVWIYDKLKKKIAISYEYTSA